MELLRFEPHVLSIVLLEASILRIPDSQWSLHDYYALTSFYRNEFEVPLLGLVMLEHRVTPLEDSL